jgi:hypothetical protein
VAEDVVGVQIGDVVDKSFVEAVSLRFHLDITALEKQG